MLKAYGRTVIRLVLVVLGVLAVLAAIYLSAVGVSYLVHHSQHHQGPSPVVTVTTSG
jgi:disulfide bond formation protein DsbB